MSDDVWEHGVIISKDDDAAIVRLLDGRRFSFNWKFCVKDGTSYGAIRIGDRVKRRTYDGAISSPNVSRWNEKP